MKSIDWGSALRRLLLTPYIYLLFGFFFIFMGVGWTWTGKIWVRFEGWVYRNERPTEFWLRVVLYYLVGAGFVGYSLFKLYEGSR